MVADLPLYVKSLANKNNFLAGESFWNRWSGIQSYLHAYHCLYTHSIMPCSKSALLFCTFTHTYRHTHTHTDTHTHTYRHTHTHTDILVLHSLLYHRQRRQGWQQLCKTLELFYCLVWLKHWCPSLNLPAAVTTHTTCLALPAKANRLVS